MLIPVYRHDTVKPAGSMIAGTVGADASWFALALLKAPLQSVPCWAALSSGGLVQCELATVTGCCWSLKHPFVPVASNSTGFSGTLITLQQTASVCLLILFHVQLYPATQLDLIFFSFRFPYLVQHGR